MKRRHFFSISTLATVATGASAAEPREEWHEFVQKVLKFTATSEEGNLTLEVELEVPPDEERVEVNDEEGNLFAGSSVAPVPFSGTAMSHPTNAER